MYELKKYYNYKNTEIFELPVHLKFFLNVKADKDITLAE